MENNNQPTYDLEFFTKALNLIPYNGVENFNQDIAVKGAFNAGAVVSVRFDELGGFVIIKLHGGEKILMKEEQAAELEATIKRRAHEYQELQAAEIQRRAEMEVQAQLNAANQAMANAAVMGRLKGLKRGS